MSRLRAFLTGEFNSTVSPWLRSLSYTTLGLVLAAFVTVMWLRHVFTEQPIPSYQPVIAKPSKAVSDVPKIDVVVKKPIKVYKGGAALKNGLKLPENIVKDDSQQVISSSEVKNDDHPHTVTTIINTETGESETYDKKEPLPWLVYDTRGSVGIYYGYKGGAPVARLEAKQDMFDMKSVRCGAVGSVDSDASYFAGLGCSYNW